MTEVKFIQISPEDLKTKINDAVTSSFKTLLQRDSITNSSDKNIITRKDVKEISWTQRIARAFGDHVGM